VKNKSNFFNKLVTLLVVLSLSGQGAVFAQAPQQQDATRIGYNDTTGKVSFIGVDPSRPITDRSVQIEGLAADSSAGAMISPYAAAFGLKNPVSELKLISAEQVEGREVTRFQQVYMGIPIMGGEMIVNATDQDELLSLSGEISPDLALDVNPTISAEQAQMIALGTMAKNYQVSADALEATEPELWIYDSRLFEPDGMKAALVWRLEVKSRENSTPVNELVLVDAKRGAIILNFNQIDTAWVTKPARADANSTSPKQDDQPTDVPTATPTPVVTETSDQDGQPTDVPAATPTPVVTDAPNQDDQPTDIPAATPTPIVMETSETEEDVISSQPFIPTPTPESQIIIESNDVEALAVTNYYVDIATGDDSKSCIITDPCQHIQETINKAASGDVIYVASGTYLFSTNGTPNVVIINKNITLSGGWNPDFTLQKGASTIDGANAKNGILAISGTVIVENFIVQNSTSSNSGAIYIVNGNFTLKKSTLKSNVATNNGAGIFLDNGTLNIINSTISGNTATNSGGGIYASNNSGSSVTIQNSTIAYNTASTGGGISRTNGTYNITNTIIANNSASSPDCKGTIAAANYNIIKSMSGCTITSGSHNLNVDPQVNAILTGAMQVHALLPASPAINTGTLTGCPATDQRDVSRPQGGSCDIGALEYYAPSSPSAILIYGGSAQSAQINTSFRQPLKALILDNKGVAVPGTTVTFTAPSSGASGTFSGTDTSVVIVTDENGIAVTPAFTANDVGGNYLVNATAPGIATPASFQLTNIVPSTWYVVTTGSDSNDCLTPDTPCATINTAIAKASSSETIYVATGTYTGAGSQVVLIDKSVTLSGGWDGSFSLQNGFSIIDGENARIGIYINSSGSVVVINNFVIQNGYSGQGGGIRNANANLTINNSTIKNNSTSQSGGGIYSGSTLAINNVTISNNTAGLVSGFGFGGGGIYQAANGLTIQNSTIANNMVFGNSDIGTSSGGIYDATTGTITVRNSIISGCSGTINISDHNIIGNSSGCTLVSSTGDQLNVDPLIPPMIYGNLLPLVAGSPAIDAGSSCLGTDERNVSRPQGAGCDIGSYERPSIVGPAAFLGIVSGSPQHVAPSKAFKSSLSVFAIDADGDPTTGTTITFTAPASGPSAIFNGTLTSTEAITDQYGLVTVSDITANNEVGQYLISAEIGGLPPVNFIITNLVWYVSPNGDNTSNDCTTSFTPCASINGVFAKPGFLSGDTVYVEKGTYNGTGSQVVTINKNVTISGGWDSSFTVQNGYSTIDGQNARTGFKITGQSNVEISHFEIINSSIGIESGSDGSLTTLTLDHSSINNNHRAIVNYDDLTLSNSIIFSNNTAFGGGGIYSSNSSTTPRLLNILNSAIYDNVAAGEGGGVDIAGKYNSSITNTVIYNNYSSSGAISIRSAIGTPTVIINNSAIVENTSPNASITRGAGIALSGGNVTVQNSIVAKNERASSPNDCGHSAGASFTSGGYNIFGTLNNCPLTLNTGDRVVQVDGFFVPIMGYYILSPDNPALDAGNPAASDGIDNHCALTDQRNLSRPQGGRCDIGAYEYPTSVGSASNIYPVAGFHQSIVLGGAFPQNLSAFVADSQGNPVSGITVTFTAPTSGASGSFSGEGATTTATTNTSGIATSSLFTANGIEGTYTIDATVSGVAIPAAFQMTNLPNYYVNIATGNDGNSCTSPALPCQHIQQAIDKAGSGVTIFVATGTYTGTGTWVSNVNKSISILGGWNSDFTTQTGYSTIDGQSTRGGIFFQGSAENLISTALDNFILINGRHSGTNRTLTIDHANAIITDIEIRNGSGVGFSLWEGQATLDSVSVHDNSGGGLESYDSTLNIKKSAIYRNSGSGIHLTNTTNASIENSTISGNSGRNVYEAGGIDVDFYANLTLNNVTITENYGKSNAGGLDIANTAGGVSMSNTIIANNSSFENSYPDCYTSTSQLTSKGYNIIGNPSGCNFTPSSGDQIGTSVFLAPLANYGGPTLSHAILRNSPALDTGNPAVPGSGGACPPTDQRGVTRPLDGNGDSNSRCDIGAFESAGSGTIPAYLFAYQGTPQLIQHGQAVAVNFAAIVLDAQGSGVPGITVTFTAPSSGATGTFSNTGNTTISTTDTNGVATASEFTATNTIGFYNIQATVNNLSPILFNVTNVGNISVYSMNHSTSNLPGQLVCTMAQSNCTNGLDTDADYAFLYALDAYNFFYNHFNRRSLDNADMAIISSVHYGNNFENALWSGAQMVYGDGYSAADDVVVHELTHGVNQYEADLFYYYQSGAIRESLSDIWGELYDQQNGLGNDAEGVKWQIGEDLPDGVLRNMSDPPEFGDPDKMTSANYYTGANDDGGVHTNSGVNNKAAYLMVDGGSFNDKTITSIGADKTLAIYYEVLTNLLTSGADYADLYNALYQGCLNLVGGPSGIVLENCQQVRNAADAVEMNLQPVANFNADTPLCNAGLMLGTAFHDDFENGISNWTIVNGDTTRWQYGSPYGAYAHSGTHFLYADDYPAVVTDAYVRSRPIIIPSNGYLYFAHAYDFEKYSNDTNYYYYDGGVLEYSANGGTWLDAGPLIEVNGYKGSITTTENNPLKGRSAFVGTSHGYIGTRLNLDSLAGRSVSFRWRMGLDYLGYGWGWWLDDVQIYRCVTAQPDAVTSVLLADDNPTSASSVRFTVTFSESVKDVGSEDFTPTTDIGDASITDIDGSGSMYTVTVNTGSGDGTIRLDVPDAATITDLDGNPLVNLPFTGGDTYIVDKTPETVITMDTPDPSLAGQAVAVTVTVTAGGSGGPIPSGTVDITGADTNCSVVLAGGTGSCNVVFNSTGAKTITAAYLGDGYYSGSTGTRAHQVGTQRAKNGGFNTYSGASKIPTYWTMGKFSSTDGKYTSSKKEGIASVKIAGASGKTKTLTQTLSLSGVKGQPFNFSYWVKGSGMPTSGSCYGQVLFYYGTSLKGTKTLKCPTGATYSWKQVNLDFTAPATYNKVLIRFTYSKSKGTAWFDLASLVR